MRILITGSNGFIGSELCSIAAKSEHYVIALTRYPHNFSNSRIKNIVLKDFNDMDALGRIMSDVDIVIHLSAYVHKRFEVFTNQMNECMNVNVICTHSLVSAASNSGVKRFIYISSIKAIGEETIFGASYNEDSLLKPLTPYGISKMRAELTIRSVLDDSKTDFIIIRPPLVYGSKVRANFRLIILWISFRLPIPMLALGNNLRSFIALENLTNFILTASLHPMAANQVFMVSDGEDISTSELIEKVAMSMNINIKSINASKSIMENIFNFIGLKDVGKKLFGNLQADINKSRLLLNWLPPMVMKDALLNKKTKVQS